MEESLLNVAEAHEILRVRRETVRRYIKNEPLKAVVLPEGDYRLNVRDI